MRPKTKKEVSNFSAGTSSRQLKAVPETGKTLLAIAKAQSLAASGLRTLLVCYNRALKDWLVQNLSDEFGSLLSIQTYHNLVAEFCEKANIQFIEGGKSPDQKFWDEVAPERLMDACDGLACDQKFDAVIVDEAQDFKSLWWDSLESVFRDPDDKSCYYVFYDPRQNLYVKDSVELPSELGPPYPLSTNCRNTVKIAQHCASIINERVKTNSNSPSGISPEIHSEPDWQSGFRKAGTADPRALSAGPARAQTVSDCRTDTRVCEGPLAAQVQEQ